MIGSALAGAILILVASAPGGMDVPASPPARVSPRASDPTAREAADAYLRQIYAVYFSIRGCTEASLAHRKAEFLPSVSLDEARRTMRNVDSAAKEVGIDTDRIWAAVGPVGVITAEALKADTAENIANCALVGGVFRIDLGNLQNVLHALGSTRALIEKDF